MEGARNWYDRVNAVNYQLQFTWSYRFVLLSLAVLLHSHNKSCHGSSGGQKLLSPVTGKETLFPLALMHTRAHPGTHREHSRAHCCNPLSFILKPTGTSRDFPPCAVAGGYFCSLIKKIRDDHRGRPRWACIRFTNDKWGFYRVADDSFNQLNSQGPSTTCQVGDCIFCNDCVRVCT